MYVRDFVNIYYENHLYNIVFWAKGYECSFYQKDKNDVVFEIETIISDF